MMNLKQISDTNTLQKDNTTRFKRCYVLLSNLVASESNLLLTG